MPHSDADKFSSVGIRVEEEEERIVPGGSHSLWLYVALRTLLNANLFSVFSAKYYT